MNERSVVSGRWAVRSGTPVVIAVLVISIGADVAAAQNADKAPGAAIFGKKCVLCHGADGMGNTPLGKQLQAANLHSKDVQKKPDSELHRIIHDGQTNMPPFGDQLTDDEIDQLVKYVRTFAGPAKAAKKQ